MSKLFYLMLAALLSIGLFTSCSDDDDPVNEKQKVMVTFSAKPVVEGTFDADMLKNLRAVFTEVRSQDTTHCVLDRNGVGKVLVFKGIYNISIEKKIKNRAGADSISIFTRMENIAVNQDKQEIMGNLSVLPADATGTNFIFSEIFFNGERNSGRMMHPDQYFVLFNPTEKVLYADGVSVAVTHHLSWENKQLWYDKYYPNRVPIGGFVTVPGSGTEHPVKPGEKLVVAFTAINHSKEEGYDHSVDLSGADFEIYYGPDNKDVDNPNVPNMLLTENNDSYAGFWFQPRGYFSPLMFKLENGMQATVEKFFKENVSRSEHAFPKTKKRPADTLEIQILSVPTEMIIDGVQTSDVPQDIKTRVIPEKVDRGKFLVNGCHRQELAIRRKVMVGNKTYYKDTNNSSDDFVMQKGQNAFPIGWRQKK